MKKKIMTTALIAAIAIGTAATCASANWGKRGGGYMNNNYQASSQGMQMQYNQAPGPRMQYNQAQQLDPAVQEKVDKFFTDTQDIRKEIVTKRAEERALLNSENPDPAAVSALAGELFDLRTTMNQKAEEAGVTAYLGPNGPRGGKDFGPGRPGMKGGGNKGGRNMNNMQGNYGSRGNWSNNVQAPGPRNQMQNNQAPGPRNQMRYNQAPGPRMQMQAQQLDPAIQEKLDTFFTDTQDLHKEIAVKRAEELALLRSENPDAAAVGKLSGELFDLRATVRQKAEEAGVATYLGPNGPRGDRDFASGRSGMRGGANKGGRSMNNMQGNFGPRAYWN